MIGDLKAKGLRLVGEADTKDFRAAFVHPGDIFGILTEIVQPKPGGMMAPNREGKDDAPSR